VESIVNHQLLEALLASELRRGTRLARRNLFTPWAGVYKLPGSDHLNAAQGPEFSLWMPSPLTSHHFFMGETVGI
jgi:hypothetical protein